MNSAKISLGHATSTLTLQIAGISTKITEKSFCRANCASIIFTNNCPIKMLCTTKALLEAICWSLVHYPPCAFDINKYECSVCNSPLENEIK